VAEVEVLRSLTQAELSAFAQEVLGAQSPARRKVAVLIRGSREFGVQQQSSSGQGTCPAVEGSDPQQQQHSAAGDSTSAAEGAGSCAAGEAAGAVCSSSGADDLAYAATAVPAGEQFLLVRDVPAFKRGCEVWPASGQQHSRQLQQQHRRQAVLSGQGTAAAATAAGDAAGEAAAAAQSEEAAVGAPKL
jgi:hypothetical protein